jgi:hypothetical protein
VTYLERQGRRRPWPVWGILALLFFAPVLAAAEAVSLSVWAVQATHENKPEKEYDRSLAEIQKLLAPLPYDTFREVQSHRNKTVGYSQETRLPLDRNYTLIVHPTAREEDGRVRMEIRVEMPPKKEGGAPIEAIAVTLLLQPGEKIKLQGLRGDGGGELIVVLGATA